MAVFQLRVDGSLGRSDVTPGTSLSESINRVLTEAGRNAVQQLSDLAPKASGLLADSFTYDIQSGSIHEKYLTVRNTQPYSPYVRSGSIPPRGRPPINKPRSGGISLYDWVLRKVNLGGQSPLSVAFAIQRSIARRGTLPNNYVAGLDVDVIRSILRGKSGVEVLQVLGQLIGQRVISIARFVNQGPRVQPRGPGGRFLTTAFNPEIPPSILEGLGEFRT